MACSTKKKALGKLSLRTHDYDGTLYLTLSSQPRMSLIDASAKARLLVDGTDVHWRRKRSALGSIDLLNGSDEENFDPRNGIQAKDLFCLLMTNDVEGEILTDILAEIKRKGSCVQGRTTRLLQYSLSFL